MLYLGVISVPQVIKAKAVAGRINDGFQLMFQFCTLGGIQDTFKYGVLHPLSSADAGLGYLAQALFPRRILRIYIISDEY